MKKVLKLMALALVLVLSISMLASCDLEALLGSILPQPECEHVWVDADCLTAKTCSVCGVVEGEALGHKEEALAAVAPTCENKGLTEGKKCSVCGEILMAQEEVDALGHKDDDMNGKCDNGGEDYVWTVAIADKSVAALYVSKTLQLSASVTPVEKTLTWTSSDEEIATVADGLVTALKAGTVTIRVALTEAIYDEITLTVKAPVINAEINAGNFDLSGIYQDDAIVKSNGQVNSFFAFAGDPSKYYVATMKANITGADGGDTWSRVGISHFNGTNSYYGFQVSPGPNYGARKVVTMVITDGNVQWGTVTDRSQIWWQHNQGALDYSSIVITVVRNGDAFYAYINGELYWVDEYIEGFSDIDTLPVINIGSATAEFSDMSVTYGQEAAEAFLVTADDNDFYIADDKTAIKEDGSIEFTGAADGSCALNAKDHAAKYIGTSAVLGANVESTVEFDLTINYFGGRDGLPALAVTLNRYDAAPWEARSLVIGQYRAGWTGWNSNGNLNEGIGDGGREYMLNGESTRLEEGETYHVVLKRIMIDGKQDTILSIRDKDGNVLLEYQWGWICDYTGRYVVSFLCRDVDCTISNIEIK